MIILAPIAIPAWAVFLSLPIAIPFLIWWCRKEDKKQKEYDRAMGIKRVSPKFCVYMTWFFLIFFPPGGLLMLWMLEGRYDSKMKKTIAWCVVVCHAFLLSLPYIASHAK